MTDVDLCLELPASGAAAVQARRALGQIRPALSGTMFDDVLLLVSELVSNAARHAGLEEEDQIEVRLRLRGGRVHAEIADPGIGFDGEPPVQVERSGYGLQLVERLSSEWGVRRKEGYTTVWFDLPARRLAG